MSNGLIPGLWGDQTTAPNGTTVLSMGEPNWAPLSLLTLTMVNEELRLPLQWVQRFGYEAADDVIDAWIAEHAFLLSRICEWEDTYEGDRRPADIRGLDASELGMIWERVMLIAFPQTSFDEFVHSRGMSEYFTRPHIAHWRASRADLLREATEIATTWFRSKGVEMHPDRPWAHVVGYQPLVLSHVFNP